MENVTRDAMQRNGIPFEVDCEKFENLPELYADCIKRFADKPAFTCLGHTLSYQELFEHAEAFAAYLQNHTNLEPGDRIAIQLPNILQYPVILYGAMLAGVVIVNTNPLYTAKELQHQLEDSGAKVLIVMANFASTATKVVEKTKVEQVIVTEIGDMHSIPKRWLINLGVKYIRRMVPAYSFTHQTSFLDVLKLGREAIAKHGAVKPYQAKRDQLALLQYTGGTTGVAKGAMLSHGNLMANCFQCGALFTCYGCEEGVEIVVCPLPLYHIYSFTLCLVLLNMGAHCYLVPDPRNQDHLISEMKNSGMTFFCGINTLFNALMANEKFRELDFSRLHVTMSGGMALKKAAADKWYEITGNKIYQGYGLTESSPVVSGNPKLDNRQTSIGLPIPNTDVKIVDENGMAMVVGESGELCVKGPQVMAGYWQRPEATAQVIDDDGWLHTGDIAEVDADGYLTIVDRKKDIIIVSGFNVYPNEVEQAIATHPDVKECAVIGVPDERSGEAVKVFVVRTDSNLTEEEIVTYSRQSLTGYKTPDFVQFVDELPKSNVGKVLRKELRKLNHSNS